MRNALKKIPQGQKAFIFVDVMNRANPLRKINYNYSGFQLSTIKQFNHEKINFCGNPVNGLFLRQNC